MGMMPSIDEERDDGGVVEREDTHVRKAVAARAIISRHLQRRCIV